MEARAGVVCGESRFESGLSRAAKRRCAVLPYGDVLYFPYIHLRDETWLKVAALYYDHVLRIVPHNVQPDDSTAVNVLKGQLGLIQEVEPDLEPEEIAADFLAFARKNFSYPAHVPVQQRRPRLSKEKLLNFRIHISKFTAATIYALAEMGLAENPARLMNKEWVNLDPRAAAVYMTFLAERIAERRGVPLVTDDSRFQSLVNYFELDRKDPEDNSAWMPHFGRPSYALASVAIKAAIPRDFSTVSIERIVEFRKSHESERRRFYKAVEELTAQIPPIADQQALANCIEHHSLQIRDAADDLSRAMTSFGITAATGLLGISLPPWLATEVQRNVAPVTLVAGAVSAYVALNLGRYFVDSYNLRRNSPWSYVLSLRRGLRPESVTRQLASGEILI